MNIDEVKAVVDRILDKKRKEALFVQIKNRIDDRTSVSGDVPITFDGVEILVDPIELKKIIDKENLKNDTTADVAELKQKAK